LILLPVDKKVSFNGNKKALVMKDLHAKDMTIKKKKEQYAFKTNKWYKLARFYNLLFVRYFDLKSPITSIYIFFLKINYSITMIIVLSKEEYIYIYIYIYIYWSSNICQYHLHKTIRNPLCMFL